jgi:RNA polymerase sigma-54 factor
MALTQRLEIRQSHALVMTPQLMQAIKLLQLSNLDLSTYVDEPATREEPNPERDGGTAADSGAADWAAGAPERSPTSAENPLESPLDQGFDEPDASAPRAAAEMLPGYSEWAGAGTGRREDGDYNLEAFVSVEATLADHLAEQLALAVGDPARRMIGQYLIDMVDEAGYLPGDLAPVA